jgi:hypothetical protein
MLGKLRLRGFRELDPPDGDILVGVLSSFLGTRPVP